MVCLLTWMNVGADIENGKYAMLGARMGCYNTVIQNLNHEDVSNLDKITEICPENEKNIDEDLVSYGESLKQRLDIPVVDYNELQSKFFKFVQPLWINRGVQDLENK